MTTALVTGADGFIGRHLMWALESEDAVRRVLSLTRHDTDASVREYVCAADVIFHLAGVNRAEREAEYREVNVGLTKRMVGHLEEARRRPVVVLASSTQASLDNEYGRSKREAEEALESWADRDGGEVVLYRLTNVFGKWARPDYNSVVATFCHRIARDLPIDVHEATAQLRLVHVGDVVGEFASVVRRAREPGVRMADVSPVYELTIEALARRLGEFRDMRRTPRLPDMEDRFTRLLHATYLSYVPADDLFSDLLERQDDRGRLSELLKSPQLGQIFVSTTGPGVVRGGHFHHDKAERFCVLRGDAVIRLRRVGDGVVHRYEASGRRFSVVDIPPGYTHDIENVGDDEMIVLFWANEEFDPERPDTTAMSVEA